MKIRERLDKLKKKQKGFTLVELIVVIAIIGILAGVMLPKYFGFTDEARESAAIAEAKSVRAVAEVYYAQHGDWPVVAAGKGFTIGEAGDVNRQTFTGTIAVTTSNTVPLDDGSFKYTKDTVTVECDTSGDITVD